MIKKKFLFFLLFIHSLTFCQSYFPEANQKWENRKPEEFNIKTTTLDKAVNFALSNEYSGSKDLRIAILKSFEREPYHQILGPKKTRWSCRNDFKKRILDFFLG